MTGLTKVQDTLAEHKPFGIGEVETLQEALDKRLPEIANYAALRSYTGPVTAFSVRGVANIFDGGFGVFRVDGADTTTADNGGTVLIDASGRRWKRVYPGAVNVKWFGIGGVDDSASVQSALNIGRRISGDYASTIIAGGISVSDQNTTIDHMSLAGHDSDQVDPSPYKDVGVVYSAARQTVQDSTFNRYKVAGVALKNSFGVTIVGSQIKAVNNPASGSGTYGYGIDLGYNASSFNNAHWVVGGEIHTCDVGVRAKDCIGLSLDTIVEGNRYAAVHVQTADLVRLPAYTEGNNTTGGSYDIEYLSTANYGRFSKLCRLERSHHNPSAGKKLALIQTAFGTLIENVLVTPKNAKDGTGVEGRITLGKAAINTKARNNHRVIIEDQTGVEVRTVFDGEVEGNLFRYSEQISHATWNKNSQVNLVEDAATDGATFLDGSAPMRVNIKATTGASTMAGVSQTVSTTSQQYHGRVIGWGVWIKCKSGQSINLVPVLSGNIQYTGDNLNAPLLRTITDSWQFLPYNGVIDSADAGTGDLVGWNFWPITSSAKNGDGTTDVYIKHPRAWVGALEHIGYIPTVGTKIEPRVRAQSIPKTVSDADYTVPPSAGAQIIYSAAITANRTVTFNTTNPAPGDRVTITRATASTGAFTVSVGGLKTLAAGQWATAVYSGSAWVLVEFGSL